MQDLPRELNAPELDELAILRLCDDRGTFAMGTAHVFPDLDAQSAFERLQLRRWVQLIDVALAPEPPARGDLQRMFLCSDEAVARRIAYRHVLIDGKADEGDHLEALLCLAGITRDVIDQLAGCAGVRRADDDDGDKTGDAGQPA